MFIVLVNRPDRMGANLTWYIMQIIYAYYHSYHIKYDTLNYSDSIFIKSLVEYIELYNCALETDVGDRINWVQESQQDWPGNCMIVCSTIGTDLLNYFTKHMKTTMQTILMYKALDKHFVYQYTPAKTIGVHLRLDDVCDRTDYDGSYSTEYYANKLNTGNITIDLGEEHEYGNSKNIWIPGWCRQYNPYDCQAPIADSKISAIIEKVRIKYPDHQVVIVASPIGNINLPYPVVRSEDIDKDLYFLSRCDVLICSRSLYCFSAVYFGNWRDVYIPMWGHLSATGLTSKYDQSKLNYFY